MGWGNLFGTSAGYCVSERWGHHRSISDSNEVSCALVSAI